MPPDVTFCRELHRGNAGNDVVAHKRAISHVLPKVYPWSKEFTPFFGGKFETAVKYYQRQEGLTADGIIGKATHEHLEQEHIKLKPNLWAFDSVAIKLAEDFCKSFAKKSVRELIVDAAFFWYLHRANIAYSQARPFPLIKPPQVMSRIDCSGFYTVCSYAGGASDPNGRGYDGQGYTGTLMSTGTRVDSINDLDPGDAIFYGYYTGNSSAFKRGDPTHVAVYAGMIDGIKSVVSMGHYPMSLYPFSYRDVNHFRHYDIGEV